MEQKRPKRWANDLTLLLNARDGSERFPVDVRQLALDYSGQVFPEDPISLIKGAELPGFEGALQRAPDSELGWGIFYNNEISQSPGRINFTLAHEFGHYLVHRLSLPDGIQCDAEDMVRWGSAYQVMEHEANDFAATLLMPLDDFRRQIDDTTRPTLGDLSRCASRYNVSLIAATLRWLQYTRKRALLVKSSDGFVQWARSSTRAFKTGAYIKTVGRPPIAVPITSPAADPDCPDGTGHVASHPENSWLPEPCVEESFASQRYDFRLSLLQLEDDLRYVEGFREG
nr:ImmA/IrrE family metallo-endopeptidase [Oceanococcus sp. HetDA_MAG_MS8]